MADPYHTPYFNGCAQLLDIGRNWKTLLYTLIRSVVSRTCSMGEHAGQARTGINVAFIFLSSELYPGTFKCDFSSLLKVMGCNFTIHLPFAEQIFVRPHKGKS